MVTLPWTMGGWMTAVRPIADRTSEGKPPSKWAKNGSSPTRAGLPRSELGAGPVDRIESRTRDDDVLREPNVERKIGILKGGRRHFHDLLPQPQEPLQEPRRRRGLGKLPEKRRDRLLREAGEAQKAEPIAHPTQS